MKKYIEGISIRELKETLDGNPLKYTVERVLSSGSLMLSGYKIIKCVSNYYETVEGETRECGNNAYKNCELTRRLFCLSGTGKMECRECHRKCIEKLERGLLKRKGGKKRQNAERQGT